MLRELFLELVFDRVDLRLQSVPLFLLMVFEMLWLLNSDFFCFSVKVLDLLFPCPAWGGEISLVLHVL